MTTPTRALASLLLATVALTACFGGTDPTTPAPTPTPVPATDEPASPPASGQPSPEPTVSTPEPVPSDDLGEFSCDLPVTEGATTARANIVDVRVGGHAGYDRVVFEFRDGLPEWSLDRAEPPFRHDASGMPVVVEGESFLRLIMRGGTKQQEDGGSSYDGPTDFDPNLPVLVDLVEGGDFEAQSTWYLGLASEACPRVTLLTEDGPPRLVIDVEG